MEYPPLGDLQAYITEPQTEGTACSIIKQVLEGLQSLHGNNFVHRDLKPGNILVIRNSPSWWVKIADFGITKCIESTSVQTRIGTLGYMAPEVWGYLTAADRENRLSLSSFPFALDLWSVGAIVFRILTGQVPFPVGADICEYVVYNAPFPFADEMTLDCRDFIAKLMDASPRKRLSAQDAVQHAWIQAEVGHRVLASESRPVTITR